MPASKYLLAFCESAGQGDHKNHSGGTDSIRAWVPGASDFDPCFSVVAFTVLPHFIGLFTMFVFLFCPQNGRSTEPLRRPLFSSFFMCLLTGLSALSVLFFKSNQINSNTWGYGIASVCWMVLGLMLYLRNKRRVHIFLDGFAPVAFIFSLAPLRTALWDALLPGEGGDIPVAVATACFSICVFLTTLSRCCCCCRCISTRLPNRTAHEYQGLEGTLNSSRGSLRQTFLLEANGVDSEYTGSEDDAGLFQQLYFSWITTLLSTGFKAKKLSMKDLPISAACDNPDALHEKFVQEWRAELAFNKQRPSLARVLHRQMWFRFWLSGLFLGIGLMGTFLVPLFTHALLVKLEDRDVEENVYEKGGTFEYSMLLVIALSFMSAVQSIFTHQFWIMGVRVCMHTQIVLQAEVFAKSTRLSHSSRSKTPEGQMSNLLASDASRIATSFWVPMFHWGTWCSVLGTGVSLYFLFLLLGNAAFGGLAVICLFLPSSYFTSKYMKQSYKKLMTFRDARVAAVVEHLRAIRLVKAFVSENLAWNDISTCRENELKWQKQQQVLGISNIVLAGVGPVLTNVVSFSLYSCFGGEITAAKIFTALLWFNILKASISRFPGAIMSTVGSMASLKRLEEYFSLDELVPLKPPLHIGGNAIGIQASNASFQWIPQERLGDNENATFAADAKKATVRGVSIRAQKGDLFCVVGPVGSGKSTILAGLTNNIPCTAGTVEVTGRKAFVGQSPWLRTATIEENICDFGLNGEQTNHHRLHAVVDACALQPDIDSFSNGLQTLVGSDGVTLSGGQRQRIALARALYSDADVYVLDDVLSAVDAHVGAHIFQNAIIAELKLKGKVVVMATHAIGYLNSPHVTGIYALSKDGQFKEYSTVIPQQRSWIPTGTVDAGQPAANTHEESNDAAREGAGEDQEKQVQGYVSFGDLRLYCEKFGWTYSMIVCILFCFRQALNVGQQYWLTMWVNESASRGTFYMVVYAAFGVALVVLLGWQSYIVVLGSIQGAKRMHNIAMKRVILAKLQFFDTTPFGRIVNRMINDIANIDSNMASALVTVFSILLQTVSIIAIVSATTPLVIILFFLLLWPYHICGQYYRWSSRDLRRLTSISKSPVITSFSEVVRGMPVVRAFCAEHTLHTRFKTCLKQNAMAYFSSWAANQWVTAVLELMGISVIFVSTMAAAILHLRYRTLSPAIIGMVLTYTLQLPSLMMWLVRNLATAETELIAVERVSEYARLPQESDNIVDRKRNQRPLIVNRARDGPKSGKLELKNLTMRYRPDLEPALRNISLNIDAGAKVAVVGRTGAGKSSLLLALMRFYDTDKSSSISIDGNVSTAMEGLYSTREDIAYVPQEAHLLSGTLRESLQSLSGTVGNRATGMGDSSIWKALKIVKMDHVVRNLTDGLETKISDGGSMFSQGERQLFCLARALLRPALLLVADEATASVDTDSETMVQDVILGLPVTVLYICHRTSRLNEFDKILTLENGQVSSFQNSSRTTAV